MTGRLAEWRHATGEGGGTVDLYPLIPPVRPRPATIRHCCGCPTCCDAYESPLPCDRPDTCTPETPCLGRVQARQWGERHLVAGCRPVAPAARGWEDWEDELLRTSATTPAAQAVQLGRTVEAVRERRRRLGVPASRPTRHWGSYEDELLLACPTLPDAEAMLPARSRQAIRGRARTLGHRLAPHRVEPAA